MPSRFVFCISHFSYLVFSSPVLCDPVWPSIEIRSLRNRHSASRHNMYGLWMAFPLNSFSNNAAALCIISRLRRLPYTVKNNILFPCLGRAGISFSGLCQDALCCPLAPEETGDLHQGEQAAPLPQTLLGAAAQPSECGTTGSYPHLCQYIIYLSWGICIHP